MTTVLVTGGAGFIGSHLCESLLNDGHHVICLDDISTGKKGNIKHLRQSDKFTFIKADVTESFTQSLTNENKPDDVDKVFHLASRASPKHFQQYPVDIARANSIGTHNVLDFCLNHDAQIVFASTSEVYGNPDVHPQPESYNGNVNPRGARACYDESKRYGEMLMSVYAREYGVDTRTARIFNTFGPRMRPDDGRVIPNFLTQALEGKDLTIYGDGAQTRSFLYVDDQVRGLRKLTDANNMAGEVVNIGSTNEISIKTLAKTVINVTNADVDLVYKTLPHEDDPSQRQPDISKANEELQWEPEISLQQGLEQTEAYFRQLLSRSQSIGGSKGD